MHRTVPRRRLLCHLDWTVIQSVSRSYSTTLSLRKTHDPRPTEDPIIEDDFLILKDKYDAPKHPIVLAHGLLGFDELRLAGSVLPGIHYWRGITEALAARGVEVITAEVPASGRIEVRAKRLAEVIEERAHGREVNIIAFVSGICAWLGRY